MNETDEVECLSSFSKKNFSCYLIESNEKKTYCGITNDIKKRIKQHNGILKGGAKSTRGYEWNYFCMIDGFISKSDVLSFEWRMHHPDGKRKKDKRYYGIEGRFLSIYDVILWWFLSKNTENPYPLHIYIKEEYINEYKEKIDFSDELFDDFISIHPLYEHSYFHSL